MIIKVCSSEFTSLCNVSCKLMLKQHKQHYRIKNGGLVMCVCTFPNEMHKYSCSVGGMNLGWPCGAHTRIQTLMKQEQVLKVALGSTGTYNDNTICTLLCIASPVKVLNSCLRRSCGIHRASNEHCACYTFMVSRIGITCRYSCSGTHECQ